MAPRKDSQVFHVSAPEAKLTLVGLLRKWLPGESWSQVRKLLRGSRVQINGNLCLDEARRLKPNDVVKILPFAQAKPPQAHDVKIRYFDTHLIIVEKPSGMTTLRHSEEQNWPARRKQQQPTLDEVLPHVLAAQLGQTAQESPRKKPGLPKKGTPQNKGKSRNDLQPVHPHRLPKIRAVHRLDRDTSGLMIFARTPVAEQKLVQMFRKHTIHRQYVAVCLGHVTAQTIESDLVRDRGDGKRGSTTLKGVGQHAVTHVTPREYLDGYSIVQCNLETGRTHQIRIHLAEKGHMLCGEKIYHTPLFEKPMPDGSGAPRIALHAEELGLTHPVSGEELSFKMPMPSDMRDLIARLRQGSKKTAPQPAPQPNKPENGHAP